MTPADGLWGAVKSDGKVTGIIGMVARREAHFAIDEITITGYNISNTLLNNYFLLLLWQEISVTI